MKYFVITITVVAVSFACQSKDSNAIANVLLVKSKIRYLGINAMDNSTVHMNFTTTGARREDEEFHWEVHSMTLYIYPVISVMILLANILIVTSVIKYKRLHTPPNIFILNTAIADLLTALITIPILLLSQFEAFESQMCRIAVLELFPLQSSLLSVFVICIDRFTCIISTMDDNKEGGHFVCWFLDFRCIVIASSRGFHLKSLCY